MLLPPAPPAYPLLNSTRTLPPPPPPGTAGVRTSQHPACTWRSYRTNLPARTPPVARDRADLAAYYPLPHHHTACMWVHRCYMICALPPFSPRATRFAGGHHHTTPPHHRTLPTVSGAVACCLCRAGSPQLKTVYGRDHHITYYWQPPVDNLVGGWFRRVAASVAATWTTARRYTRRHDCCAAGGCNTAFTAAYASQILFRGYYLPTGATVTVAFAHAVLLAGMTSGRGRAGSRLCRLAPCLGHRGQEAAGGGGKSATTTPQHARWWRSDNTPALLACEQRRNMPAYRTADLAERNGRGQDIYRLTPFSTSPPLPTPNCTSTPLSSLLPPLKTKRAGER